MRGWGVIKEVFLKVKPEAERGSSAVRRRRAGLSEHHVVDHKRVHIQDKE